MKAAFWPRGGALFAAEIGAVAGTVQLLHDIFHTTRQ